MFHGRRTIKICAVVFALFSVSFSVFSVAEKTFYDRELSFVREVFNFHVVSPNIMRASQPSAGAIRLLKKYCGIKTVLSLRDEKGRNKKEEKYLKKLGIKFINVPMNPLKEQSIETIEKCLQIISDKSNQPILVHCREGKDRTGLIFAAYRMKYDNWSLEDAVMEMLVYGYNRPLFFNLERSLLKWNDWRKKHSAEIEKALTGK
ncbi:MAG: dual specificity protein phosphatase family protein [Candidatus Omnitrophota bacterium]|nr:dual specificity protein phosphatase family protein [Candidatus Omnitrophota bacterium]